MGQLTQTEAAYAADLAALVRAGTDKPLPIYNVSTGNARMVPVSEFLGECHKDAQALLFRACAQAEAGNAVMAVSLLRAFTQEVASEYGVTTAETLSLIADPDAMAMVRGLHAEGSVNIRPWIEHADWVDSVGDWAVTHQPLSEAELDRFIAERIPAPVHDSCAPPYDQAAPEVRAFYSREVYEAIRKHAQQQPAEACTALLADTTPAKHSRQRGLIVALAVVLGAVMCAVCLVNYGRLS